MRGIAKVSPFGVILIITDTNILNCYILVITKYRYIYSKTFDSLSYVIELLK